MCDQGGGHKRTMTKEVWTQLVMDEEDVGEMPAAAERKEDPHKTKENNGQFDYYKSPILLNGFHFLSINSPLCYLGVVC